MVVLEITSEAARTNMPVNGAECVVAFMVVVLMLKFIVDYRIDMRRQISQEFTTYQNEIKRAINGEQRLFN